MKRLYILAVVVVMGMLLVACERPLRDEEVVDATPSLPAELLPGEGEAVIEVFPAETTPSTGEGEGLDQTQADAGEGESSEADMAEGADQAGAGETSGEGAETGGESGAAEAIEEQLPASDVVHTVQSGETLSEIAQQYDIPMADIVAANGLANPNVLDVGDELLIPLTGLDSNETETTTEAGGTAASEAIHIVRSGDTLFSIGRTYGFTVEELAAYNNIANVNRLDVGQEIRIPPSE